MKGNFTWKTFVLLGKPWFHPEKKSLQPIQTSEILISMVSAGASINHLPVITIIWLVLCRNHSQWVVTMTYVLPSVLPTFWKFYHLFCPQKMENRYKSPSKCGCFTFYILFYLYTKWKIMEKSVIKSPWRNHRFQTSAAWRQAALRWSPVGTAACPSSPPPRNSRAAQNLSPGSCLRCLMNFGDISGQIVIFH